MTKWKKPQPKINNEEALLDWCDNNVPELHKCLESGCDYAMNWLAQMEAFERREDTETYTAYIASILLYVAYHKPYLLGKNYQWAVDIEQAKKHGKGMVQ